MRLLVLYYSQSGESRRAAKAFAAGWDAVAEITYQSIEPVVEYPHPWRSVGKFFGVMPDCLLGNCPPIRPPRCGAGPFDYVVLAYPVWFLSPALPVQAVFHQSDYARLLRDADVITICVCRSMWHNASQRMKSCLRTVGATHRDNIVVTHQGSFWATLVSTPRALLFGLRNRFLNVFPRAGISEDDIDRLGQLGRTAAACTTTRGESETSAGALLRGESAVHVKRRFVVPELVGWYFFYGWALIIDRLARLNTGLQRLGVAGFVVFLLALILIALPLAQILTWLLLPIVGTRLTRYAECLAEPTGEPNTVAH
jgi:hypothetical protein